MFLWTGALDRPAYVRRAAIVIAFMATANLLVPALCGETSDSFCAALGFWSLLIHPAILIVLLTVAVNICIRRARDAGLRPWIGALPALVLLGDWTWGAPGGIAPPFVLSGIALMAALAIPATGSLHDAGDLLVDKTILVLACGLAAFAIFFSPGLNFLLNQLIMIWLLPWMSRWLMMLCMTAMYGPDALALVLFPLIIFRLWYWPPAAAAASASRSASAVPSLWRPWIALLIGVSMAGFAVLRGNEGGLDKETLILLFLLLLPNALIYAALVAALLRIRARRDVIAIAFLLVTLIPFGLWAAALASALWTRAQARTDVAALPKVALPAKPDTIVVDGVDPALIDCAQRLILSAQHSIDDVLIHAGRNGSYLRFTRAMATRPATAGEPAHAVPAEHILVRLPPQPHMSRAERMKATPQSPPVEIYAVDPDGTHLVAAIRPEHTLPAFPPLLIPQGWAPREKWTAAASCKHVETFLDRELLGKLPRQSM
jgi:hypothetical protein